MKQTILNNPMKPEKTQSLEITHYFQAHSQKVTQYLTKIQMSAIIERINSNEVCFLILRLLS